ncbi:MAG: hypothetical protein A2Z72_01165 [Omnitrophica bacterium RBG_13_46_9]|nr:MAG: hypothetical protein A2Z72_01165 [Omnitrophica bacterium RBG_13_46_9]
MKYGGNTIEIHGQRKVREIRCAKFVIRDNFNGSLRKQHMQPLKLLQPMQHKTGATLRNLKQHQETLRNLRLWKLIDIRWKYNGNTLMLIETH